MSGDGRNNTGGSAKTPQSLPVVTDPRSDFESGDPSGRFLGVEEISSGANRDWSTEEQDFKRTDSGNYDLDRFERTASGNYVIPQFERTQSGRYRTAVATGTEAVRIGKVLVSVIDALVRSIRARGRSTLDIAQRAIDLWLDEPDLTLSTTPNAIAVGPQVVYETQKGEGEWILPLFMAGVRHIGVQRSTSPADLCRFAEQLGELKPTPDSVEQFRDWVWADGAAGLVLDVRMSYLEAFEALDLSPPPIVPMLLTGQIEVEATSSLPKSADEKERTKFEQKLQAPFLAYEAALQSGSLEVDDRERIALRATSADGEMWALAELETAITDVRLARAVAPERIANALWARITTQVDVPLLRILAELVTARDEHSRMIVSTLERVPLGGTIAKTIPLNSTPALAEAHRFLSAAPQRVAIALVHGLLSRAGGDVGFFDGLVQLARMGELRQFQSWIDPGKLTPDEAATIAYVMNESFGDTVDYSSLLAKAPLNASIVLVTVLSPASVLRMKSVVKRLLADAQGDELVRLLEALVKKQAPECVRLIGEEIDATGADGWPAIAVRGSFRALMAYGFGKDHVLPAVWSKQAPKEVRLAALDAMAGSPQLLAEAARWRVRGMLDDPEIRRRLKALRKEED